MVPDGFRQEIASIGRVQPDDHLCAAEVLFVLIANEFTFRSEVTLEVARNLEYGHRTLREDTVDAHADAGLKVRFEPPVFHHVERDGAVGEEDLSRLYVDAGRIGLEAGDAGEGVGNHHRHKRRDIAFATGGNPFGIEAGEGQAAGVAHGGQKVEAAKGEGVQVMAFCQDLQRLIDLHRAGRGVPDLAVHHLLRGSGFAINLLDLRKELFHRHFLHPDAQLVQQGHRVHVTGDKPVRGLADDADAHVLQAGAGFLHRG